MSTYCFPIASFCSIFVEIGSKKARISCRPKNIAHVRNNWRFSLRITLNFERLDIFTMRLSLKGSKMCVCPRTVQYICYLKLEITNMFNTLLIMVVIRKFNFCKERENFTRTLWEYLFVMKTFSILCTNDKTYCYTKFIYHKWIISIT